MQKTPHQCFTVACLFNTNESNYLHGIYETTISLIPPCLHWNVDVSLKYNKNKNPSLLHKRGVAFIPSHESCDNLNKIKDSMPKVILNYNLMSSLSI